MEYILIALAAYGAGIASKGLVDRAVARWKRIDFDTSKD
jgi:hypothetical protein